MSKIKLDTTILDNIARELPDRTQRVGRKMAFLLENYAKRKAPVDTGALRNSIYTVTQTSDGFSGAISAAKKGTFTKGGRISRAHTSKGTKISNILIKTEFEPHPTPAGKIIANVGPCVNYAEYQEFGTSKMAAHPFMTPAVELIDKEFSDPKNWEVIIA